MVGARIQARHSRDSVVGQEVQDLISDLEEANVTDFVEEPRFVVEHL